MKAWNKKRKPKYHSKVKWKENYLILMCWVINTKKHKQKIITSTHTPLKYNKRLRKKIRNIFRKPKLK